MPPIHKGRVYMDPNTYGTIMIGHASVKVYGTILEVEPGGYMEMMGL